MSSARTGPKPTEGWVYAIFNPAWPGHVKIGSALDLRDRLKVYNTSSPYRDFQVVAAYRFGDRRAAEKRIHGQLQGVRIGSTEWFALHPLDARNHLIRLNRQENA